MRLNGILQLKEKFIQGKEKTAPLFTVNTIKA